MDKEGDKLEPGIYGFVRGYTQDEMKSQSVRIMKYPRFIEDFGNRIRLGEENDWTIRDKRINLLSRGSILVVESIVHISNSIIELIDFIDMLDQKGIKFYSMNEKLSTVKETDEANTNMILGAMKILGELKNKDGRTPTHKDLLRIEKGVVEYNKLYSNHAEQMKQQRSELEAKEKASKRINLGDMEYAEPQEVLTEEPHKYECTDNYEEKYIQGLLKD